VGIADALSYLSFPGSHHTRIRSTNMLERLFQEVKRRMRVVGVFPNETSASTLATEIVLTAGFSGHDPHRMMHICGLDAGPV
jgi:transposase-like protein